MTKEKLPDRVDEVVASTAHSTHPEISTTRRGFLRAMSAVFLVALGDQIAGGPLLKEVEKLFTDDEKEKIAEIELEGELNGLDRIAITMAIVDYIGTLNFVLGVRSLLPQKIGKFEIPGKEVGHIDSSRYAAIAILTLLKYKLSDAEGKHHLIEETEGSIRALGIISGTIVAAEGLNLDIEHAYEEASGRSPERKDRVAVAAMLGSAVSPFATTVGSASLLRKMTNDLAKTGKTDAKGKEIMDEDLMAVMTSHISNLSGYILLGDPPFIAVKDKYGFEGMVWQFKAMLPLYVYSLATAMYKMNLILARREGCANPAAQAAKDTTAGFFRNIPTLAKIIAKSIGNAGKYFLGAKQNPAGIELAIGETLAEKFKGLSSLMFSDKAPEHLHEEQAEGMIHEVPDTLKAVDEYFKACAKDMSEGRAERSELEKALDANDYEKVVEIGRELGVPGIEIMARNLSDMRDNSRMDDSSKEIPVEEKPSGTVLSALNPINVYERASSVDRMKGYLGHNLGDVVNVFPFQAGSVPFLIPIFKDGVAGLDALGLNEKAKELVMFFLIMLFSMLADNYVACKIGLELFPEKPQLALIASIQGGSMTAIGNMANVAQFNLQDFPLMSSFAKMLWHIDDVAVGLAWSQALELFEGIVPSALAAAHK